MSCALESTSSLALAGRRIRVMIVDDAVVVRGLFARWVEAEADLELAATVRTGHEAVSRLEELDPDVVVLDVEMPGLDGIAALPLLLAKKRNLVVIMASTVTRRNAEISLRALSLGAADYIPKPQTTREVTTSTDFRRELIEKIRQLGLRAKRRRLGPARKPRSGGPEALLRPVPPSLAERVFTLRPLPNVPPRVLLIGASTGGPQALNALIPKLGEVIDRAPVLITQHMPPTFTTILAEHLSRLVRHPVREAKDGEEIKSGVVYIAPGGRHMRVERRNGIAVTALGDDPPINFCKPSVDPLFFSAAEIWGSKVLALVLTGMGSDGLNGARALVAAGGHVVAQDEASSVVWGMPGQVAHAGLCSAILPLAGIASQLTQLFGGKPA
ncbi:MAG: chemotaxis response regulator protein-glutamate methylesterase [Pseudolabrys sp.]|nr:chemotaxis response regulator protein-glutamate methylesterase [Pseudolabrys sp.]